MRIKVINFLKHHPIILDLLWGFFRTLLSFASVIVPTNNKRIVFVSFGGRKFDDSPKALYDEVLSRQEFHNWDLIWAFVSPNKFIIPRGRKVRIDTIDFFITLLSSKVWISNSDIDRGIGLNIKGVIRVETWHGTPLKKIGGDENTGSMLLNKKYRFTKKDNRTIRCAQSEYDRNIFMRIFHATQESILLSDLPRNDSLLTYSELRCNEIKHQLGISKKKKVILYTPTYREYAFNSENQIYLAPPIEIGKWQKNLDKEYVLLFRAHYAVTAALRLEENHFVKDVSQYPYLNDLYAISDIMISDYSSTYFDYAILDRPMFCFAYDLEEYEEKRGLYLDLNTTLPCPVDKDEDTLLKHILEIDYDKATSRTKQFHARFSPYAGYASSLVVNKILDRLK